MTQLHGARSGHLVRTRRGHDFQQDLQNSDCIVIMGSNMAENHPVGFQWVMEARERGAKVIHVDPRFTRTSAMATKHVGIRAGSDIAFLGGIANYILEHDLYFREYVAKYTNAPVIIDERFVDTEDADGLFSGWDPEAGRYDIESWRYQGMEVHGAAGQRGEGFEPRGEQSGHGAAGGGLRHGEPPAEDPELEHPRCVLQILKRHYRRYTPEFVAETCGCPVEDFLEVCRTLAENSGESGRAPFATRSAGRSTRRASRRSARPRSSSSCSATSAGPAAESWPSAATPRSRARRTSRRSSTSSPATCRCLTR